MVLTDMAVWTEAHFFSKGLPFQGEGGTTQSSADITCYRLLSAPVINKEAALSLQNSRGPLQPDRSVIEAALCSFGGINVNQRRKTFIYFCLNKLDKQTLFVFTTE